MRDLALIFLLRQEKTTQRFCYHSISLINNPFPKEKEKKNTLKQQYTAIQQCMDRKMRFSILDFEN